MLVDRLARCWLMRLAVMGVSPPGGGASRAVCVWLALPAGGLEVNQPAMPLSESSPLPTYMPGAKAQPFSSAANKIREKRRKTGFSMGDGQEIRGCDRLRILTEGFFSQSWPPGPAPAPPGLWRPAAAGWWG